MFCVLLFCASSLCAANATKLMSQCTCVALHHDDTTSLNMAISNFMRQGHEIGKSIRAGKEDKQLKVHSMSGGTADTHFQRHASNIHE